MRDRLRTRKKSSGKRSGKTQDSGELTDLNSIEESGVNGDGLSAKDEDLVIGLDVPTATPTTPRSQAYHTHTGRTMAQRKEKPSENINTTSGGDGGDSKTPPPPPPWIPPYKNSLSPTSHYPSLCLSSTLNENGKSGGLSGSGRGDDGGILLDIEDIELINQDAMDGDSRNNTGTGSYRYVCQA